MRLIITGGHVTPALAVIEELMSRKNVETFFVGRKHNSNIDKSLTLEYKEITSLKIPFFHLTTGRLTRLFSKQTFFEILKIPLGVYYAWRLINKIKPDKILSFGGYIALPVAFCGFLKKIPVYTHEQTINPGIANRIIGLFANKIFLSFPESNKNWNKSKVIISGNPIRKQIFQHHVLNWVPHKNQKVLFITGGSLGAHSINQHISRIINQLTAKYTIIHQTGDTQEYDDFTLLSNLRFGLPKEQQENYIIKKHISGDEIGSIYCFSDLVIGRAGANTISELIALKKPAILIPLPWSAGQEQLKHAEYLNKNKVAEIFEQSKTSKELLNLIEKTISALQNYQKSYLQFISHNQNNAAQTLANSLFD